MTPKALGAGITSLAATARTSGLDGFPLRERRADLDPPLIPGTEWAWSSLVAEASAECGGRLLHPWSGSSNALTARIQDLSGGAGETWRLLVSPEAVA